MTPFEAILSITVSRVFWFVFGVFGIGWVTHFFTVKTTADLQARVGPSRIGLRGAPQFWADYVKELIKSSTYQATKREFFVYAVGTLFVWIGFVLLPFPVVHLGESGSTLLIPDSPISALVPLVLILVYPLLELMTRFYHTEPSVWAALIRRVAQQTIALLPAIVSILSCGVWAGGLSWKNLGEVQGFAPYDWLVFRGVNVIGVVVYFVSVAVFCGYGAFGGFRSKGLSFIDQRHFRGGWGRVWEQLLDLTTEFILVAVGVYCFMGGDGVRSFALISGSAISDAFTISLLFGFKITAIIYFLRVVSSVVPLLNGLQISQICWRFLLPISFVCLAISGVFSIRL